MIKHKDPMINRKRQRNQMSSGKKHENEILFLLRQNKLPLGQKKKKFQLFLVPLQRLLYFSFCDAILDWEKKNRKFSNDSSYKEKRNEIVK